MAADVLHSPDSYRELSLKEKRDTIFSYEMTRRFSSDELLRNSLDRIMAKLWQEYMRSIINPAREA